jgi:hypothetical protein
MPAAFRRPLSTFLVIVHLVFFAARSNAQNTSPGQRSPNTASARQILQKRCYSCHGRDGLRRGGFQSILDRDRLIAGRIVVPGKPGSSPLYEQIANDAMPKKGRLLDAKEKAVIRKWIADGAPSLLSSKRTPIPVDGMLKQMAFDLEKIPVRSRRFVRYLSLVESHNAGVPDERLEVYRHGLTRLLNSLSWNYKIVPPTAIDQHKTIYRIDVRDYYWSRAQWERVAESYPYGVARTSVAAAWLARETGTQLAVLRADWFLYAASRPPLYHELLELPKDAGELERRLGVNVSRNLGQERRVVRAGFDESGVSKNNRIIERHTLSKDRGYWRSYDFASSTGASHIKSHPLGPGRGQGQFRHDGGEVIFHLPNGLQAYLLVDGLDRRIDVAPVSIVSDAKASPPAIVNGVSCMRCHVGGMISKADEIRANAASFTGETKAKVLALYQPNSEFEKLLTQDRQRFERAVKQTGAPEAKADPVFLASADYQDTVTLKAAAAETGVSIERLTPAVTDAGKLAPLARGQTVKREAFEASFGLLAERLKLGRYLRPSRPRVPLAGASSPARLPRIQPQIQGNKVVVELPERYAQVCTGGAGRYLIFHFKKARKLAIFDVATARIVHQIPLSHDVVHYAAGRDKLMIVLPGPLLQRVSLKTFEREKTVPLPGGPPVLKALMGCNSTGPLVLWSGSSVELWDVETMKPMKTRGKRVGGRNQWDPKLAISADGRSVIWGHAGLSPTAFSIMRIIDGKTTTVQPSTKSTSSTPRLNADGSLVFCSGHNNGVFRPDGRAIPAAELKPLAMFPTEDPRFFLALRRTNKGRNTAVLFCLASESRPIYTMEDLEPLTASAWPSNQGHAFGAPRAHYLPDANLFVTLPELNEKVIVRKFELLKALDKTSKPYLFVLSVPPRTVVAGSQFAYQIDAKSKAGGVAFKLTAGPEGMAISDDGRLTWRVPADLEHKTFRIVVTVRDRTGREVYHSFDLKIP